MKIPFFSDKKMLSTSIFNSFGILLRILTGFVTSKILAVFVGPNGMALVGNFRNFINSAQSIGTVGTDTGLVKYVAEFKDDSEKIKRIVSTVFFSILMLVIVISILLFVLSNWLNKIIFGIDNHFVMIFQVFAIVFPFYIFSVLLIAFLNGLSSFKKVIFINIFGNIFGLLATAFFVYNYNVIGALLSIIIAPSLLFFVAFYYVLQEINIFEVIKWKFFDKSVLKNFGSYVLMILFTSIAGSIIMILIRNKIIFKFGLSQAGFWEAMTRISGYYMLFINSIMSLYFFPKLAETKTNLETKAIIKSYFSTIIPIFIVGLIGIYFFRNFIISILFSDEFSPTETLFFWQLLGDVFRASSLILGFYILAKKLTKVFMITELFSFIVLYFSSLFFLDNYNIQGVSIAYCFTYFIYFFVLLIYFRKKIF